MDIQKNMSSLLLISIGFGLLCNRVLINFKKILMKIRKLKINKKVNNGSILIIKF
jgi:hypothetical protein